MAGEQLCGEEHIWVHADPAYDPSPAVPPRGYDRSVASDPLLGRFVGPHLQLKAGLLRAANRAVAIRATAVQVFVDNPTAWRRKSKPPARIDEFRRRLEDGGVARLAVHASYLVNLAAASAEFRERSIEGLIADLVMAEAYGAHAVNVHIGSHVGQGAATGTRLVGEGLAEVLRRAPDGPAAPRLVLENAAGGGGTLGSSVHEIAAIVAAAVDVGAPSARLGVCLDTSHLWGYGYDLSSPAAIDALLDEVASELGLGRLAMLHLNDLRVARGSRLDRHEHIGAGRIDHVGLRHLLTHPDLVSVPIYLETPAMERGYDAINLDRVWRLIRGEPLPELPADAFDQRSRRARSRKPCPPMASDVPTDLDASDAPSG